jgi:hypothetical protein
MVATPPRRSASTTKWFRSQCSTQGIASCSSCSGSARSARECQAAARRPCAPGRPRGALERHARSAHAASADRCGGRARRPPSPGRPGRTRRPRSAAPAARAATRRAQLERVTDTARPDSWPLPRRAPARTATRRGAAAPASRRPRAACQPPAAAPRPGLQKRPGAPASPSMRYIGSRGAPDQARHSAGATGACDTCATGRAAGRTSGTGTLVAQPAPAAPAARSPARWRARTDAPAAGHRPAPGWPAPPPAVTVWPGDARSGR